MWLEAIQAGRMEGKKLAASMHFSILLLLLEFFGQFPSEGRRGWLWILVRLY